MFEINILWGILMDNPRIKKEEDTTSIFFFTLDNNVEEVVRQEIESVFNNNMKLNNNPEMKSILYACTKELMVNASKSNIKKTFFIEAKINENDREVYNIAKKSVLKLMNEHCLPYMREKLKKYNYEVEVKIENKDNGIVLTVRNPTPLLEDEEQKIREIFKLGMQNNTSDISLFYSDEDDCSEGAGIGLLLVINLLKEMGINPALFRMGVVKNDTIARIEIPLTKDFVSFRN